MGTLPRQRPPACAGRFYEGSPERLREQVRALLEPDAPRVSAPAIICPHAGLMYSGAVAGAVYSRVTFPTTAILVGPNHTGFGPPLSVYSEGEWLLPGGSLTVAADLARSFLTRCPQPQPDHVAHLNEHCLEGQPRGRRGRPPPDRRDPPSDHVRVRAHHRRALRRPDLGRTPGATRTLRDVGGRQRRRPSRGRVRRPDNAIIPFPGERRTSPC